MPRTIRIMISEEEYALPSERGSAYAEAFGGALRIAIDAPEDPDAKRAATRERRAEAIRAAGREDGDVSDVEQCLGPQVDPETGKLPPTSGRTTTSPRARTDAPRGKMKGGEPNPLRTWAAQG